MTRSNCYYYDGKQTDCYDVHLSSDKCHLPTGADIFLLYSIQAAKVCPISRMDSRFDKHATESLQNGVRSLLAIMPFVVSLTLARIAAHSRPVHSTQRFLIEFVLVAVPGVYFMGVGNKYSNIYLASMGCFLALYAWRRKCLKLAKHRNFELGKRPAVLTLLRATAYLATAVGILAIDFKSFPRVFRKSRRFGASLMDTGIGIFVLTMGVVSRRAQRLNDFRRLSSVVVPLLVLGMARTVVLSIIDYSQDEHEYGVHLNAFFTLGFAKLFGTFASSLATSDKQLFPLSIGVLTIHEMLLQLGISDYVMDDEIERDTFVNANREGIASMTGFVAMYLFAIAFTSWLRTKTTLSYSEMMSKLRYMVFICVCSWLLVVGCAYTIGIARVTCNFGYAVWIFAVVQTVITFYMVLFDVILNSALPVDTETNATKIAQAESGADVVLTTSSSFLMSTQPAQPVSPIIAEALNMNGLVFFLLTNVLTGVVNIFLSPDDRNESETMIILVAYMFLSMGFIFVLHRKNIRTA